MAYEKQTWVSGEVITATKLNHMEDGIANGGDIVVIHSEDDTFDKTWREIFDAITAGQICYTVFTGEDYADADFIRSAYIEDNQYMITSASYIYAASNENDYPVLVP